MLGNKNKKISTTLIYIVNFLSLVFAVTVCIFISNFASFVNIPERIMSSTIGLSICAIIARFKKCKSIIKKKRKNQDAIELLAKTNLDLIKSSISRF